MCGIKRNESVNMIQKLNIKEEDYKKVAADCSLGTRMKVGLSLIFSKYDYKIICIDESLSHLDAIFKRQYLVVLQNYARIKKAIVIFIDHEDIDDNLIEKVMLNKGVLESK